MQDLISLLNEKTLFAFLLLFARLLAFVAFVPVFGHPAINSRIRVAVAFYITIFLFPLVDLAGTFTQDKFVLGLISEITLGLLAAFFLNIAFSAVRIIGDLIGYSTALSMGMQFDPASGVNEGLVSRLLYWIALIIFFETGMYETTIVILTKSFSIVHLGSFNIFSYDGLEILVKEIKRMFAFAFAFALPLFFISFIMDIYYGYGTKSMPSFSPFVITFQLKFVLIFVFLILGMEMFTYSFTNYLITKFQ